jgi:hypothetical protein
LTVGSAAKLEVGKQPRDAPYESNEMKLDNGGVNMANRRGRRSWNTDEVRSA